ncbi:Cyclin-U4-1 [Diplonema papillatum]|nr:Cyclin-U4-1 [Diplonema papillatum]
MSESDKVTTVTTVPNRKSFNDIHKLPSYTTALPGISDLLTKMVAKADAKQRSSDRTPFDGSKPAPVSIQDYLIRLCKYGYCSNEVFILLLIYLGRLRAKTHTVFTSFNIHRLLLTSFVVAAKLRDDTYYSNKYYASIGGVSLSDMNRMEQAFLRLTKWELHVVKEEFDNYHVAMHPPATPRSPANKGSSNVIRSSGHTSGSPYASKPKTLDVPTSPATVEVHPDTDDLGSSRRENNDLGSSRRGDRWLGST